MPNIVWTTGEIQNFDFLGQGLKFPFQFSDEINKLIGTINETNGYNKIKQSVAQILNTPLGTRVMNRAFGCNIWILKFEPLDEIFYNTATYFIADALAKWEKRLQLNRVNYDNSDYLLQNSMVVISCYYTVIKTQVTGNYVFPFYSEIPNVR